MPHLIVEYSANLDEQLALDELLAKLHDVAAASGVFPLGGIRTRASRRDDYLIADGDPDNGFVHVVARIGEGRPLEVRQEVGQKLFDVVCAHTSELFAERGLSLSFEIQEIPSATSFKKTLPTSTLCGNGCGDGQHDGLA